MGMNEFFIFREEVKEDDNKVNHIIISDIDINIERFTEMDDNKMGVNFEGDIDFME